MNSTHKTPVSHAFSVAALSASVFGLCLFFLLFVALMSMKPDGSAPGITHFAASLIQFTVNMLGIASDGSAFIVTFFWSAAVFMGVFVFLLVRRVARR